MSHPFTVVSFKIYENAKLCYVPEYLCVYVCICLTCSFMLAIDRYSIFACMYACMHVCMYVCMLRCHIIHVYTHEYITDIHAHTTCTHSPQSTYIICMHVCIYIHTYIHMHAYINTRAHIYGMTIPLRSASVPFG